MTFTLRAVDGPPLRMATLEGKVAVLDFWATWCGPCRAQHPLYEQVKQRFAGNPDVIFLSIDADEDRSLVKPFLSEAKWPDAVYFEDGLSRAWAIHAIPTTVVLDRSGRVSARMSGYVPERFVEMLGDRITEALEK
jgi:thiol-disulfide isomerase/thioredoxin